MVDADFPNALWRGYFKHGIRPEYQVACLNGESGINPGALNSIGCAGINQICPNIFTIPDGYSSWTASQQLDKIVTPLWTSWVAQYGAIDSGARLEQCNFFPVSLLYAKGLDDVIVAKDGSVASKKVRGVSSSYEMSAYAGNAMNFDVDNTKVITPRGIAAFLRRQWKPFCQDIVTAAYANAPAGLTFGAPDVPMGDIGPERDPILGTDYGIGGNYGPSWGQSLLVVAATAAACLAVGMAVDRYIR